MEVSKTYKLYVNGAFIRSESGRYFKDENKKKGFIFNLPLASRKDLRNAVEAAGQAQYSWSQRTAYNRSQIIYRISEMLQPESERFVRLLQQAGLSKSAAQKNFDQSIDEIVSLAGWCDKFVQVSSSVNPVASSHFNFSVPEPTGIACSTGANEGGLLSIVRAVLPAVCGGNTIVFLSEKYASLALEFSEVVANSDVPSGVINILTGSKTELMSHMAKHMAINALNLFDCTADQEIELTSFAAENVKRLYFANTSDSYNSLQSIMKFQEIKTTWHPIDRISGSGSSY